MYIIYTTLCDRLGRCHMPSLSFGQICWRIFTKNAEKSPANWRIGPACASRRYMDTCFWRFVMRMLYHVQIWTSDQQYTKKGDFWRCLEGWQLWVLGYRLKLPGARVNARSDCRNDCRNDCKCANPAKDFETKSNKKRQALWNPPMQTSLWREPWLNHSFDAWLRSAIHILRASLPWLFPWLTVLSGCECSLYCNMLAILETLRGSFHLILFLAKNLGPSLPMEFNSQDNWCKGMTEWPLPSPYPIWTESLMSRRSPRTPVRDLSQRQLWWPHFLRDRNSVQQCAYWHPVQKSGYEIPSNFARWKWTCSDHAYLEFPRNDGKTIWVH